MMRKWRCPICHRRHGKGGFSVRCARKAERIHGHCCGKASLRQHSDPTCPLLRMQQAWDVANELVIGAASIDEGSVSC